MTITNILLAAILAVLVVQWVGTDPLIVRRVKRALKLGVYRNH